MGKSVRLNGGNLIPVMAHNGVSYPEADVRYAYDEQYLYFAADIIDDDYIPCTKFFVDNYVSSGFDEPKSFFAYDGDVVALAFDWKNLIASDIGFLTDRPSFFCFGLFEDGHIGAYHTSLGEKDLTSIVRSAGVRTDGGWRFEAAVQWDEIAADLDLNSFGNLKFDLNEMTEPGADNKACVYFVDRYFDPEMLDVEFDNVYASYREYSHEGGLSAHYNYFFYGLFGIDLKPTKNGGADCTEEVIPTTLDWTDPFSDLDKKAWYYNAVSASCDNGWFAGTSETTFTPSGKLTRGMIVTILARVAGYDGTAPSGALFKDVPADKWYAPGVGWAAANGVVSGIGDGYFDPDAYLTREQAAMMLYRFAQYKKYRTDGVSSGLLEEFPDTDKVSDWAVSALEWAVHNGLISGTEKPDDVYLDPGGTATRAQCAQIVYSFDNTVFIIILLLLVPALLVSCSGGQKPVDTDTAETTAFEEETSTGENTSYSPVQTDPGFDESDYVLTFFDDFEGTALDMTKWSYCPDWERGNVGGRWDRSMISLDGAGSLVVTSDYIRDENGSVIPISGAIRTANIFEQCKGYFEIRCKLQSAKGFWFAFWLMCDGEKATTDGITNGAEIDIVEAFDVGEGFVNHALHWDGYGSKMKSVGRPVQHKDCYDGEFHTFSLLWDDDGYRFYVDGELSTAIIKGQYDFPEICEVPTYLKITSEFGTWSSYYDINELPDSVLVDYVKVYAAK